MTASKVSAVEEGNGVMQTELTAGVSIFANYAPQDIALQQELKEHLRSLQQAGLIELWPDRVRSAETA